jgi:chromosome partitioning protein
MVADGARIAVMHTDPQRHLESWAKKEQASLDWLFEEDDEKLNFVPFSGQFSY